jgi:hypothetical protein
LTKLQKTALVELDVFGIGRAIDILHDVAVALNGVEAGAGNSRL